eukprot:GGOE01024992.1.p2 GENE.GGOE01024992.1~~GGOE01024992.1.p2  ORF type:complete len:171 (-),score=39.14 GGOE01024992.1:851-1288(-)
MTGMCPLGQHCTFAHPPLIPDGRCAPESLQPLEREGEDPTTAATLSSGLVCEGCQRLTNKCRALQCTRNALAAELHAAEEEHTELLMQLMREQSDMQLWERRFMECQSELETQLQGKRSMKAMGSKLHASHTHKPPDPSSHQGPE